MKQSDGENIALFLYTKKAEVEKTTANFCGRI